MKKYLIISVILGLAACSPLPEGYGLDNPEQYSRVYLAAAYNGVKEFSLEAPEAAKIEVYANYSGVVPLSSDLAVSLGADLSLVIPYNSENGTSFKPLPEKCFSLESAESVIRAGDSTANVPAVISIITSAFDDGESYLLPVKILSLSDSSIALNEALDKIYLAINCKAGTLYISANPLTDYTISNTENW